MKAATMVSDPKDDLPVERAMGTKKAVNTELLDLAVKAHGGLDRWNKVKAIKVGASITGAIWFVKGKGDSLKNVVLTAETRNERLTVDFPGQDKRAIFEPNRIVIETVNGTLIEYWMDDTQVLGCDLAGEDLRERIKRSRFRDYAGFAHSREGRIVLQHRGTEAWFRKLRIETL